jgi:hypothetical protein
MIRKTIIIDRIRKQNDLDGKTTNYNDITNFTCFFCKLTKLPFLSKFSTFDHLHLVSFSLSINNLILK